VWQEKIEISFRTAIANQVLEKNYNKEKIKH
jgi:hypothetical protein